MRKFTFSIVCLLFMAGVQLFGASLPIKGGYYRIRNFTTGNTATPTFIGGTGTGNGSVIHQSPSVDSLYQIFKVTQNSANGYYSFQQKQSGLFITHDNSWNGSYAAKVATTRQSFFINNVASTDYCILYRVKDDNSHTQGLGYDQAAPGSTLYMDKGTGNQNKWIFEPIISLDSIDLKALVDQATLLNPTALASQITSASSFLTSKSEIEILTALATLQTAMDNYKIAAILESAKTATTEAPVDVTGLLVNPSFEEGFFGWTNSGFSTQTNPWSTWKAGTTFIEKWIASSATAIKGVADASLSQTLKMSMPNGKYKLVASAQGLQQGDTITHVAAKPTGVSLFGNLATLEVADTAVYTLNNIIVVDNTLTIGIKTVSATANWVAADNFQLFYQGVDLQALTNTLSGLVTTGNGITGVMQTAAATELAAAIAEANTVISTPSEATLNASIARVSAAITAANASKTSYINLNAYFSVSQDTVATYFGEGVNKTSVNASIAWAKAIYDAHLLDVAGAKATKDSLVKAVLNFQMDYATEVRPVILTSLIVNPGFDGNSATGWSGATGATGYNEYELYNKSTLDFNQIITGLRKGQYKVTVQGFHRKQGNNDADELATDNGSIQIPVVLYANTTTKPMLSVYSDKTSTVGWTATDGLLYPNSMSDASVMFLAGKYSSNAVVGYVGESGSLQFGIKNIGTPLGSSWTIFDNFQLTYIGMPAMTGYIDDLEVTYGAALESFNAIDPLTQVSAEGVKAIGKYNYADYHRLDSLLSETDNVINLYRSDAYTGLISDVLSLQANLLAAKNAMILYLPMNELPNGEYYMQVAGMFYFNNPGIAIYANDVKPSATNSGLVMDMNVTDGSQIIKIAKLSGVDYTKPIARYSMFSLLDGRNITEKAVLQELWGSWDGGSDDEWRTHNIYYNGVGYAVQPDGSSKYVGFWSYNENTQEIGPCGAQAIADSLYDFNFIPVKTVFATEVAKGRPALNAAVIGAGDDQYSQITYDAFKTALETAEAAKTAGTATSTELFAYESALKAFVKNSEVAVKHLLDNNVSAFGGNRMIRVMSNTAEKVTIFSLTGSVVSKTISAGTHDISIAPGCYLVRVNNSITKVIVR